MRRIHLAFSNRVCYTIETDDLTAMGRTHLISLILFPLIYRGVAQFGRALGSGPRGRVFKSHHSDQYKCPETVYSCGFRAFLFICGFRRFSVVTHIVTHTGFRGRFASSLENRLRAVMRGPHFAASRKTTLFPPSFA